MNHALMSRGHHRDLTVQLERGAARAHHQRMPLLPEGSPPLDGGSSPFVSGPTASCAAVGSGPIAAVSAIGASSEPASSSASASSSSIDDTADERTLQIFRRCSNWLWYFEKSQQ